VSTLDEEVRRLVDERLRELGIRPDAGASYDRDHLPPGYKSGEAFAGECRRLGLDRAVYREGRSWSVPRSIWDAARREDRDRRRGPTTTPAIDPIDATLERAGLRLVRGPR
jgi:hypothetical protein